jgi:hypothetical protein
MTSNAPLFSATEMAAFRDVALQGMQTPCSIYRRSTVETDDGQQSVWAFSSSVMGWIYSTPTAVQSEVSGKIVTINTYRAFFPVGTDIIASDRVVDLDSGQTYITSDTIAENTWNAMLRASLRFAE